MGTYIVIRDLVGIHATEASGTDGDLSEATIRDQANELAESLAVEDGETFAFGICTASDAGEARMSYTKVTWLGTLTMDAPYLDGAS